jgi:shikimate kinase/3-dehydroquinate synthase
LAIVLIGFMGAGKSTAAVELAAALGTEARDSDALLAERAGRAVAEQFEQMGEQAFRAAEEQLVLELLARADRHEVIALGGGSVLSEAVRDALAGDGHLTVLLDVDAETAWWRVAGDGGADGRPLARDRDAFGALHAERQQLYESCADAILSDLPRDGVLGVMPTLRALARAPKGTRLLWARSASGDYPVLIGRGLLSGALDHVWPLDRGRSRPFCVTDTSVGGLYGERLGELAGTLEIEPGESQKTLAGAGRVWSALVAAGLTRADHLVALGGGVVGDLTGFCAATYQRGIPVVQIPTTLVAQVDSAYGGKTGVDLPEAKNYVGVYHQPAGVLTDPDVLNSLPAAELAAGWVEVLKTGLISGGPLWEAVSEGRDADERMIGECVRTKLATVAADERDGSRRQVLNLGHTVGHGIEAATSYNRYRHGEAVGLGLLAALRLSGQDELRDLVERLLSERSLPVRMASDVDVDDVMRAIGSDKKRLGKKVPFVLVRAPGDVQPGFELAGEDVRAAVEELVER